jgi:hypothetical protein
VSCCPKPASPPPTNYARALRRLRRHPMSLSFQIQSRPSTCRPVRRPPPGSRPRTASRPSLPLTDLIHRARSCLQDGRLRSTTTATTSCTVWPPPPNGGPSAASPASCRGRSARQLEPGSAPPSH